MKAVLGIERERENKLHIIEYEKGAVLLHSEPFIAFFRTNSIARRRSILNWFNSFYSFTYAI